MAKPVTVSEGTAQEICLETCGGSLAVKKAIFHPSTLSLKAGPRSTSLGFTMTLGAIGYDALKKP